MTFSDIRIFKVEWHFRISKIGHFGVALTNPTENYLLDLARSTSPNCYIPVFFQDCDTIKAVKSGKIDGIRDVFPLYGGIKVNKEVFKNYSDKLFLKDLEHELISRGLQKQMGKNLKKGVDNMGLEGEGKINSAKIIGSDENSLFIVGNGQIDGSPNDFVSIYTVKNGITFK